MNNLREIHFPRNPEWNFFVPLRSTHQTEPSEYAQPPAVFALSDIEGEFGALRNLLIANNVTDAAYNWTFGKGHLVICGDIFDRGQQVMECLWLLYKLEADAIDKGGYVHVILGNHEVMNLGGDLRYVHINYLEDAWQSGVNYMDVFSNSSILGRWLRSKNIIEKIGEGLYLHAGVSEDINELNISPEKINAICRSYYGLPGYNHPGTAGIIYGINGPFWYRNYFYTPDVKVVNATLKNFNVKYIVVGHTIVPHIMLLFKGKVYALDVDHHEHTPEGLLIENNLFYKVNDSGVRELIKA